MTGITKDELKARLEAATNHMATVEKEANYKMGIATGYIDLLRQQIASCEASEKANGAPPAEPEPVAAAPFKRKGRPAGSKNKPKAVPSGEPIPAS